MSDYRRYGRWALIAGGSEGIGLSFAEKLAEAGLNLILLARREEPLIEAKKTLKQQYPTVEVEVYSVDLAHRDLEQHIGAITADKEIGMMIYNAGATTGVNLFHQDSLEKTRQLIDLNCHGPATLCRVLSPAMIGRGCGAIVILSSMSGLAGSAYNATYSAVKAFEITLVEGLWAELKGVGIDVLCLVAGKTDTPSLERMMGEGSDADAMSSDEVALEGLANLANGPVHVAGSGNREAAAFLSSDRKQATEMLSAATADMYGRKYPIQ